MKNCYATHYFRKLERYKDDHKYGYSGYVRVNTSTELDVLARDAVIAVPRKSRHWQTPA